MSENGSKTHDQPACVKDALRAAQAHCAQNGLQLTPIRERVLGILLEHHRAMGAYEILDILHGDKAKAQPPVAYRALDFLVMHGFAHRVERLNAFVACTAPGDTGHAPVLLICRACESVTETPADTTAALGSAATGAGFAVERAVLEAEGLCPKCQEAPE